MSAIIPWSDPDGTPCCCTTCDFNVQGTNSTTALTSQQYAILYAGGNLSSLFSASVTVGRTFFSSFTGFTEVLSAEASASKGANYIIPSQSCAISNPTAFGETQATTCDIVTATTNNPGHSVSSETCTTEVSYGMSQWAIYDRPGPVALPRIGLRLGVSALIRVTVRVSFSSSPLSGFTRQTRAIAQIAGAKTITIDGSLINLQHSQFSFTLDAGTILVQNLDLDLVFTPSAP